MAYKQLSERICNDFSIIVEGLVIHLANVYNLDIEKAQLEAFTYLNGMPSKVQEQEDFVRSPIWIGKCYEEFNNGDVRRSVIVGGVTGQSHIAYKIVADHTAHFKAKGIYKWGYKGHLKKVSRVWMFPEEDMDLLTKLFKEAHIDYTINSSYGEEKNKDEPTMDVLDSLIKETHSMSVEEKPSYTCSQNTKGAVLFYKDKTRVAAKNVPKDIKKELISKLKTTKKPVLKQRKDGHVWEAQTGLVYEYCKELKYPNSLKGVGMSSSLNGKIEELSEEGKKILDTRDIKHI